MTDLLEEIRYISKTLDKSLSLYKERGSSYAQYEHDYRVALAKFMGEKRAEGMPVTILNDLARGEPNIAKARLNRDIALSLYESCKEAIQVNKLKLRIVNEQINREWNSGGKQ